MKTTNGPADIKKAWVRKAQDLLIGAEVSDVTHDGQWNVVLQKTIQGAPRVVVLTLMSDDEGNDQGAGWISVIPAIDDGTVHHGLPRLRGR